MRAAHLDDDAFAAPVDPERVHVRASAGAPSWDCPCHGSRFDVDGTGLEGPAVKPLTPVEG